jgi:DNA-binding transcriptional MerR regulator
LADGLLPLNAEQFVYQACLYYFSDRKQIKATMNNFSIKDIERLSGIKAHTLRIWEQRHGLSFCKRKESQHRYYDNDDLKKVLRIAFLYHQGYKISRIALLSEDQINELANGSLAEQNFDIFINQMVEASIDYDQPRFEKIVQNALIHLGFEKSITRVFYPFMEKIGLLWITNHIIPAQEHFSSYLIQKKILVAIEELETAIVKDDVTVLLFCPEGEFHEIPLLVIRYLLKKNGIRMVYFGVNTSVAKLEYYCMYKPATHLCLHFITNFSNKEPGEYLACLTKKFPGKKIVASGPVFQEINESFPQVLVIKSLEEFMEIHKEFLNSRP